MYGDHENQVNGIPQSACDSYQERTPFAAHLFYVKVFTIKLPFKQNA